MRKSDARPFIYLTLLFFLFIGTNLYAEDSIIGKWNGTLDAGGAKLRLALTVTETDSGMKAVLTSIDQGNVDIPVDRISVDAMKVIFEVKAVAGSYSGELNDEKNEIDGDWTQSGMTFPLVLRKE
jgi:hypothetical protein